MHHTYGASIRKQEMEDVFLIDRCCIFCKKVRVKVNPAKIPTRSILYWTDIYNGTGNIEKDAKCMSTATKGRRIFPME
jgi:hypothetical protein